MVAVSRGLLGVGEKQASPAESALGCGQEGGQHRLCVPGGRQNVPGRDD